MNRKIQSSAFDIMLLRTLFFSLLLFLIFFGVYWPIFPGLYHLWLEDNNNSHGLLVPFVSLFLMWKKRKELKWDETKSSNIGLLILIVSLVFYIIGYAGGVEILPRLTIVTTLIGLIIFNLGLRIFSVLAFPVFFMFFMVPLPISLVGIVAFPLQLIVTKISAFLISSLSIPVMREGNILYFTNTSLEVAEACSGIRSLVAYIMLGVFFAYLMNGSSIKRRSILVLVAIPLAVLANLVRVTATGILAHFFGGSVARGFLHEVSGMTTFAFGFIILCLLYNLLEWSHKK